MKRAPLKTTSADSRDAEVYRLRRALEDQRAHAALMAKTSHDPVSMSGFSFLAAKANEALEAA